MGPVDPLSPLIFKCRTKKIKASIELRFIDPICYGSLGLGSGFSLFFILNFLMIMYYFLIIKSISFSIIKKI